MENEMKDQIPESQPPVRKEPWQRRLFRDSREIVYILGIFMLLYVLCFRMVVVVGDSMYDTLVSGDRLLLLSNVIYRDPQPGDVVVCQKESFQEDCIIKRIIAVEGQTVDIDFLTGAVYVDGVRLQEEYISSPTMLPEGTDFPLTVQEGCVFVMGDNRMDSKDSRHPAIGQIDCREILGKAIFLLLPGTDSLTGEADFGRIGVVG